MAKIFKKILFHKDYHEQNSPKYYYLAFDADSLLFKIITALRKNGQFKEQCFDTADFLASADQQASDAFYETIDNLLG